MYTHTWLYSDQNIYLVLSSELCWSILYLNRNCLFKFETSIVSMSITSMLRNPDKAWRQHDNMKLNEFQGYIIAPYRVSAFIYRFTVGHFFINSFLSIIIYLFIYLSITFDYSVIVLRQYSREFKETRPTTASSKHILM